MNHYRLANSDTIFSPGLLFFKDLIQANIAAMIRRAGGVERLRPHVKTHKCPQVVELQMQAGITRFKCATLAEAEMLARCGAPDVLLAYPMVGPNIERVAAFLGSYPQCRLAVLADHPAPLTRLSQTLERSGSTAGVYLDIDVGQHRTGIAPGPTAVDLYRLLCRLPNLRPQGLHVYDGHTHQDALAERQQAVDQFWDQVLHLRESLLREGLPVPAVVVGGTPTFPIFAASPVAGLECSPGTCVLHDHSYGSRYRDMPEFVPAALVLTRVISKPAAGRLTFDLGYKAIASDPPPGKRCILLGFMEYQPVLHNEEHFVIETAEADRWQPGDVALAVPAHVCPTVNLHQAAHVVSDGRVVDTWPIVARDRRLSI